MNIASDLKDFDPVESKLMAVLQAVEKRWKRLVCDRQGSSADSQDRMGTGKVEKDKDKACARHAEALGLRVRCTFSNGWGWERF